MLSTQQKQNLPLIYCAGFQSILSTKITFCCEIYYLYDSLGLIWVWPRINNVKVFLNSNVM